MLPAIFPRKRPAVTITCLRRVIMESLEGQLLLASPQLLDPNFVRTVVLLVEHNDMGALGLVINRPTGKTVQELWKQVGESPCESQQPVHLGGPVSGPLMAIHTADGLAEMEVVEGVFFAAKKQNLDELVRRDESLSSSLSATPAGAPGNWRARLNRGPGGRSPPSWKIFSTRPTTSGSDSCNGPWPACCRICSASSTSPPIRR